MLVENDIVGEKWQLSIYHDYKLVKKLDYPLPKTYIELSKIDL